ncbi:MAG: DUF4366 domain-containing protein [Lachnospiraceae bacterium]|nr:DUF4366 domain-containing protein [Lachnospiraceae bacterium]MDE7239108.1 DUF4366 domain-containing protein [Lachnospiraceae bacterium]
MNKKLSLLLAALVCMLGWGCFSFQTMAATEEGAEQDEYITVSVDAQDDSGELLYAIDSDAPEAFGSSNIFVIDPNVPHTIYVKDMAGNITSQSFQPIGLEVSESSEDLQGSIQSDDLDHGTGIYAEGETAEDGTGTMYEKVITDGTDDFSRVFYTVVTKEGEVFYLVIDQNRGQDNVYLLNMVTVDELQALADENGYVMSERSHAISNNPANSVEETIDDLVGNSPAPDSNKKKGTKTNTQSTIVILVVAVIGGGGYYYLKVYKKKKDAAMDEIDQALDMNEFVSDDQDDGDEIDMPVDDQTISDDEFYNGMYDEEESAYLDMDPDEEEGE